MPLVKGIGAEAVKTTTIATFFRVATVEWTRQGKYDYLSWILRQVGDWNTWKDTYCWDCTLLLTWLSKWSSCSVGDKMLQHLCDALFLAPAQPCPEANQVWELTLIITFCGSLQRKRPVAGKNGKESVHCPTVFAWVSISCAILPAVTWKVDAKREKVGNGAQWCQKYTI